MQSIIRAYDIRGVFKKSLSIDKIIYFAQKFADSLLDQAKIVIARDGRIHSQEIFDQFSSALCEKGIDVIDIGEVPTPVLWFAIGHLNNIDAGVMITASHNPPQDNGFKIALKNKPLIGEDFFKILNGPLKKRPLRGKFESLDVVEKYIANMKKSLPSSIFERKDVVWDTGHGVAGPLIRKLFPKTKILYEDVDGRFPAHSPDPSKKENMKDLQKEVLTQKASLGIGIDADGDRLGVVDKNGRLIPIELVSSLFVTEILQKHKNATIIGDIKSSRVFQDSVEKNGGNFVLCKTGHSYIKNKMSETEAVFAAEASGHLFFADDYPGFDDAIYASLRLLSLDCDLTKLVNPYISNDCQFECDDREKFVIVERIKKQLTQDKKVFCDLDGVRIDTNSGWWLVRASNTQSLLVCRCEADHKTNLDELTMDMVHYLKQGGVS